MLLPGEDRYFNFGLERDDYIMMRMLHPTEIFTILRHREHVESELSPIDINLAIQTRG
jgi:hypothetical protein